MNQFPTTVTVEVNSIASPIAIAYLSHPSKSGSQVMPSPFPGIDPYLEHPLNGIYDRAAYDLKLDYSIEPVPPLLEIDAAWVDALLKEEGLR